MLVDETRPFHSNFNFFRLSPHLCVWQWSEGEGRTLCLSRLRPPPHSHPQFPLSRSTFPGLRASRPDSPRPPHTTAETRGKGLELSCLITMVPSPLGPKINGIKGNMPGCPWWDRTELQNCSESCP